MARLPWAEIGLVYCAVIWGSTFYLVKGAVESIDPFSLVAFRFLLSAACLIPAFLAKRNKASGLKEAAFFP